jgi:hypothetical protein
MATILPILIVKVHQQQGMGEGRAAGRNRKLVRLKDLRAGIYEIQLVGGLVSRNSKIILPAIFGAILFAYPAWAWFAAGHEIVAVIAADDLTPSARSHVAQILGMPADTRSVEKAMAAASIRPDSEFREEDRSTASWHYIDLCLQDSEQDVSARCPHGNCITAKIDEYARRLRDGNYDKWGAAGDLAFLIHFIGDLHQPLHTTTNADRGGTCQEVNVTPVEENLHYAWDDAVVAILEQQLDTHAPEAAARKLETLYPAGGELATWRSDESEQVAWESHQLAKTEIYGALGITEKPCMPHSCDLSTSVPVTLSPAYMDGAAKVAGRQLAKAGYRLAALLNQIWLGGRTVTR